MKQDMKIAWLIARRELVDQLRDWRILAPMLILVLMFPFLMNFVTKGMVDYINQFGAALVAGRVSSFLLLVAGFFPVTVALVVALEAFVGEKERGTIEPLLSSPVQDKHIYLGKLIAGSIVPLVAGYLSIGIYLYRLSRDTSVAFPDLALILQIVVLNAVQTVLMVSAAIVISTQSTSVRAANLLASFIVLPVGLLVQGESYLIFWGDVDVLWVALAALVVLSALFIRLGLAHFQRERLLGRELDMLDFMWMGRVFWTHFNGSPLAPAVLRFALQRWPRLVTPENVPVSFSLAVWIDLTGFVDWYKREIVAALRRMLPSIALVALLGLATYVVAFYYVDANLPDSIPDNEKLQEVFKALGVDNQDGAGQAGSASASALDSLISTRALFLHNVRSTLLIGVVGILSFGVVGILAFMLNVGLVGGLMAGVKLLHISPTLAFVAGILPHGIFEMPALVLSVAAMLYVCLRLVTPERSLSIGEVMIHALADWIKIIIGVCVPLFFFAALVESNITARIIFSMFGRMKVIPDA